MAIEILDSESCEQVSGGKGLGQAIVEGLIVEGIIEAGKAVVNHVQNAQNAEPTPTNLNPMGDVQGPNSTSTTGSGTTAAMQGGFGDGGGGGGGKVICTELCRTGAIEHKVWMADIRYSRENFSAQTMRGYHLWGVPYVKLMRKSPLFAKLAEKPTRWFAEDIAYRMGVLSKPNYKGWVLREVFFRPVCFGIGLFAKARDWQALWRDGAVPSVTR